MTELTAHRALLSFGAAIALAFACGSPAISVARAAPFQSPQPAAQNKGGLTSQDQGSGARKEAVGPEASSIHPYRPAGRDPFKMNIVKPPGKTKAPKPLGFPTFDVRRAEFRQKASRAHASDLPEPDPLIQYLVSELNVLGVFSDERGAGAFLRAQPTGTTFFARTGSQCYNGQILRIETEPSDLAATRVIFKERSYTDVDGKQTPSEHIVAKSAASQGKP